MPISAQEHTWRSRTTLIAGLLSVSLLLFGALGSKWGLWPYTVGLLMVTVAIASSLLPIALLLGFGWHPGYREERRALLTGAALAAIPFAMVLWTFASTEGTPIIHDVSTDTRSPPTFHALLQLRGPGSNRLSYTDKNASDQRKAWPDITPLYTPLPPDQALARAINVAHGLGWKVIEHPSRPGYVEAVDTTTWFGFKDDIVIRVRAHSSGSIVDLRSVSRVGKGDLGANARRIHAFLKNFHDAS